MIKVQVSDTEFRWLLPHRILTVKAFSWPRKDDHGKDVPWDPWLGRTVLTDGLAGGEHSTPPCSIIAYRGMNEDCPGHVVVKETPEQIAEMVKAATVMVQIEPPKPETANTFPGHLIDLFISNALKELGHEAFLILPERRVPHLGAIMAEIIRMKEIERSTSIPKLVSSDWLYNIMRDETDDAGETVSNNHIRRFADVLFAKMKALVEP